MTHTIRLAVWLLAAMALTSCGDGGDGASADRGAPGDPNALEPRAIGSPLVNVEDVETLSEEAANALIEFSDALRSRDRVGASGYLTADFRARGFAGAALTPVSLPLGARQWRAEVPDAAPTVDASGFLDQLDEQLDELRTVQRVFFKTRGAEFEPSKERGLLRMTVALIGRTAGGGPRAVNGRGRAEVVRDDGGWKMRRFILESYDVTDRDTPLFSDVAETAGLSFTLPRLGKAGNENFYWRGAACADVDGDGRFDIWSSSRLYRNRGDGRFDDVTAARGLDKVPGAPTSSLFLDYDRDGDLDLFCAYVGWEEDGVPYGDELRLFRNDGAKGFVDVSAATGLAGLRTCAFSTIAADFDGDGWLDIYVCSYERLDAVYPNSWYAADNGKANLLLMNRAGRTFEETAADAGVAGRAWSYAAAAADYDGDGDQDVYVANDYGANNLYRNKGDGTFEDVAEAQGVLDVGNGMGAAWGDLDGDGKLDLYVSNMSSSAGNRILRRLAKRDGSSVESTLFKLAAGNTIFLQRDGGFEMVPPEAGGIGASWAWSPSLLDIDLDGRLDIYVANGFISGDSLKDT